MTLDENGKLVSNVAVGVTTERRWQRENIGNKPETLGTGTW
jgi:hypothetical protein